MANFSFDPSSLPGPSNWGGGGGGKGKGGGRGSGSTTNTLRSKARARIIDLIGEGVMEAVLVDGDKSLYLDETPIRDDQTNEVNFEGITYEVRSGLPDQAHLNGATQVETPVSVEVRVKKATSPPVRTISAADADAVRVIMRIPSLLFVDKEDSGEVKPTSVSYAIDVRPSGGDWTEVVLQVIEDEKTTSPYQKAHRVPLEGSAPWDLRVRRLTDDSDISELQNETWWESYFILVEGKFIYPNSALVYLEVDAELFGSSMPERRYHAKGIKVAVPSNYNPVTRAYTGIWDGTFQTAYTNNPAWVLNDVIVNDRYGLGEVIDASIVDKWNLYQIGQYCDQLVPSGFKDDEGDDILEARYTFNGVINTREEAFTVLRNIATAFRGMTFWALNQVTAIADMPADPVQIVTPANVIGGMIHYSGSALRARHSVALVTWNDPRDFDRPTIETVIDEESLRLFGWREMSIQLTGCRSQGMAHRYGRWALLTERLETDVATYEASWDHATVRPGHIIAIADPAKAQVRNGGRLKSIVGTTLTLDAPFAPGVGETYSIMVQMPDGTVETKVIEFAEDEDNLVVEIASAFTQTPIVGAMWAITGTDVEPRLFRVLSVNESEPHIFRITATVHYPNKYAEVEQGYILAPPAYTRPKNHIEPPTNLKAAESLYFVNGAAKARVTLSWSPAADFMSAGYIVSARTPDHGLVNLGQASGLSIDFNDSRRGQYTFLVSAVSHSGLVSRAAELVFDATGWEGVEGPYVSHLEVFGSGNANEFVGRNCRIVWRNNFPGTTFDWATESAGASSGNVNPFYRDNIIRIWDVETGDLLRQDVVVGETYTYTYEHNVEDNEALGQGPLRRFRFEVAVRDHVGRESSSAKLIVENPAPEMIIPTVSPGLDSIFVSYLLPNDLDFAGALIWVSTDPDFDPDEVEPTYEGINNVVSLPVTPFETYYVRLAGFDAFGTDNLNVSPALEVTPGGPAIDVTAPDIPGIPSTSATIVISQSGDVQSVLTASWTASGSENLGLYEVAIRPVDSTFIVFTTSTPNYEWRGLPFNVSFEIKVRAVSKNGYASGYSDVATQLIPLNTTAPGAPTSLVATASLRSIFLTWANPADTDLTVIEVYAAATNSRGSASLIGTTRGTAFTHTGVTTAHYYWVRAKNTSGVVGDYNAGTTAGVLGTPALVIAADITAATIDATKFAAGIEPVGIVDALPTALGYAGPKMVLLTTDGQLYRYNSGAWTTSIPAVNVTGQLTNDQLAAIAAAKITGTITGTQIASGAISTAKLAAGAVTANEIAAGAIVTDKLAAGAITAAKIAANTITATEIAANAITASELAANSVIAGKIAAAAVSATEIAAGAIIAGKIAAGVITATELAASSVTAGKIAAGAVLADTIQAGAITGDKLDITTALPATITVGGTGVSIGTVESRAADPAARVNAHTTTIQPGKVLISGATTLSSWRNGADATKIEGGSIAANTIAANTLYIGLRGIDIAGIQFQATAGTNRLDWSAGVIAYTADNGSNASVSITASFVTWTTGTRYIYWVKGATTLSTATTRPTGADDVILATYRGARDLVVTYGRTIIDGQQIITNSITANQLAVAELISNSVQIGGGVITNTHLAGNITFDKMTGGTLSTTQAVKIGGDRFVLRATTQTLEIHDGQAGFLSSVDVTGRLRVKIGALGAGTTNYGINIYDSAGNLILGSQSGFGANVVPQAAISGQGAFATLDQITAANVSTYIASAAIGNAYIGNLSAAKITTGTMHADRIVAGTIEATHIMSGGVITDSLALQAVTNIIPSYTAAAVTVTTIASITINRTANTDLIIFGQALMDDPHELGFAPVRMLLYIDRAGTDLYYMTGWTGANEKFTHTAMYVDESNQSGNKTYNLRAYAENNAGNVLKSPTSSKRNFILMEVKR